MASPVRDLVPHERRLRIAGLLLLGWALAATVLAVGPDRLAGWLTGSSGPPVLAPSGPQDAGIHGPPVEAASLPGWNDDRVDEALPALLRSCRRLLAQPGDRPLKPVELGGTPSDWRPFCGALEELDHRPDERGVRAVIERELVAVPVFQLDAAEAARPGGASGWLRRLGLFTGYFEPLLHGSRRRSQRYDIPLHMQPHDLVSVELGRFRDDLRGRRVAGRVRGRRLEPYDDRQAIVAGSLADRGLELVWVDDPVDAFFLQIQGSGRIQLDDGSILRVGYAGQNGHPYHAISRTLIARGHLKAGEASMQSIDAWLRAHPDQASEVMATNASYVFFREVRGDGPIGAQGVALTGERSLAVDRRHVPLGVPVWLDAMTPQADPAAPDQRRQWLLVAQDTGGAIRGSVRGDVFWGAGERARAIAGRMAHRGRYWVLVPRGLAASP